MPLSNAIFYLGFGVLMGPEGLRLLRLNFSENPALIEHLMRGAVILSLFSSGLKLRLAFSEKIWTIALRLASLSMLISVMLITAFGYWFLHLPVGLALILGAILSPTDPVLASDVQISEPGDRDKLRFALTGEAGFNDGSALPFLLLGLGLLGNHDLGTFGARWFLRDFLWASLLGIFLGYYLGRLVGIGVLHLRKSYKLALGFEEFLALGLMAFVYGSTEILAGNGFLAVFTAGLALRRLEHRQSGEMIPSKSELMGPEDQVATDPSKAPAFLTQAVLSSNELMERITEVFMVVTIGSLLHFRLFTFKATMIALTLFLIIRPLSVAIGLVGTRSVHSMQRLLIGWFGIRGLGSIYYVAFAVNHGLSPAASQVLVELTLVVVVYSILIHGMSVTPIMEAYEKHEKRERLLRRVLARLPLLVRQRARKHRPKRPV